MYQYMELNESRLPILGDFLIAVNMENCRDLHQALLFGQPRASVT